ncbi:hypothetical protein LCGC14_2356400 [marine sediment metagenome]|uniref:Uncharacterized protein n=1 Tax=marine sediment metagenome TaxID=412755 RepID=A0A0F9CV60_9ZZZZ
MRVRSTLAALTAVALLYPASVLGQARSRYEWGVPALRGLNTVGGRFAEETYGLTSLRGSSSAPSSSSILGSSIGQAASFNLSRSGLVDDA